MGAGREDSRVTEPEYSIRCCVAFQGPPPLSFPIAISLRRAGRLRMTTDEFFGEMSKYPVSADI